MESVIFYMHSYKFIFIHRANLLKDRDAKPEGSKVLLDYDSRLPHLALRECDMGI